MNKKFAWSITALLVLILSLSACAPFASQFLASQSLVVKAEPTVVAEVPEVQPALDSVSEVKPEVQPQATQQSQQRQVTVYGTGKVFLVPDVAYINIGVSSRGEKVKDTLADNNTKTEAVKKALVELGVEEKDIQTSSFNIYPQPQYDSAGTVISTLYVVENTMYLTVRDLNKLGQMLDAAVTSGANNIYGIQFDILAKDKAQSEARKLAVADAKKQAEELATAVGGTLGEATIVIVSSNSYPVMPNYASMGMGGGGYQSSGQVPVSAGQLLLTIDVQITYELK